ncbi:MAG: nucleotide exchange factor GrpE [Candidatus Eisenbacteria bacterium]
MSPSKKKREDEAPVEPNGEGGVEESAAEAPSEADELGRRAADLEDKWLRAVADLDNFRKRTARDRERDLWAARAGVTIPLLEVLDDFDRALGGEEDGAPFRKGVEMIRGKFVAVLEGLGVRGFDSVGEPFDPERHDALQNVPDPGVPAGHVAAEIRRGYLSGDRVLRPAMVAVAAPAAEEAAGRDTNDTSSNE